MIHRGDLVTVLPGAYSTGMSSPKSGEPFEYRKTYVDRGNQIAIVCDLDTEQEYHVPIRFIKQI